MPSQFNSFVNYRVLCKKNMIISIFCYVTSLTCTFRVDFCIYGIITCRVIHYYCNACKNKTYFSLYPCCVLSCKFQPVISAFLESFSHYFSRKPLQRRIRTRRISRETVLNSKEGKRQQQTGEKGLP